MTTAPQGSSYSIALLRCARLRFLVLFRKLTPREVYVADFSDDNAHHDVGNFLSVALEPFYTVLLLAPEVLRLNELGGPIASHGRFMHTAISQKSKVEAEVFCISHCLEKVIKQWAALDDYLDELLAEEFMDPKEYVKLLFDDENFTRSQKYFWAIGCLGEFDTSISDNIKQWDLYFEARIKPLFDKEDLADLLDAASLTKALGLSAAENGLKRLAEFKAIVRTAENHRESLVDLQAQFRTKLETVKAFRDGVRLLWNLELRCC
jgi:hypothetical protein